MTWVAGHRREAERGAHAGLDLGVDVRVGADGARQLAHGDAVAGGPQAAAVAVGLQGPQRELGPEGRRLGVHAVGAAGDGHVQQLEGARLERGHEGVEVGQQEVGRPGQRGAQRGVHHVRGGQPVVDVRAGRRADALLHDVDEGGHVVVGDLLALEHVGHEDVVDRGRLGPAGGGVVRRHDADGGLRLGGQQLDLEPHGEAGGVAEQRGHVGRGVARDHRAASRRRDRGAGHEGGDVVAHLHALPVNRRGRGVGALAGLLQRRRHGGHAEHAAAGGVEGAARAVPPRAGVEDGDPVDGRHGLPGAGQPLDGVARAGVLGVARRGQDDAHGGVAREGRRRAPRRGRRSPRPGTARRRRRPAAGAPPGSRDRRSARCTQ